MFSKGFFLKVVKILDCVLESWSIDLSKWYYPLDSVILVQINNVGFIEGGGMNIAEIVENLVTGVIENLFETVENFSSYYLSILELLNLAHSFILWII